MSEDCDFEGVAAFDKSAECKFKDVPDFDTRFEKVRDSQAQSNPDLLAIFMSARDQFPAKEVRMRTNDGAIRLEVFDAADSNVTCIQGIPVEHQKSADRKFVDVCNFAQHK